MSKLIDNFIEQNESISNFIKQIGGNKEDLDKEFETLKDFLLETNYNINLGITFALFLQVLQKVENISSFELKDISKLFDCLIRMQEFNIDNYFEAGNFEWAVMDNKQKAIDIIKKGISKGTNKTNELKKLLSKIEKDE